MLIERIGAATSSLSALAIPGATHVACTHEMHVARQPTMWSVLGIPPGRSGRYRRALLHVVVPLKTCAGRPISELAEGAKRRARVRGGAPSACRPLGLVVESSSFDGRRTSGAADAEGWEPRATIASGMLPARGGGAARGPAARRLSTGRLEGCRRGRAVAGTNAGWRAPHASDEARPAASSRRRGSCVYPPARAAQVRP